MSAGPQTVAVHPGALSMANDPRALEVKAAMLAAIAEGRNPMAAWAEVLTLQSARLSARLMELGRHADASKMFHASRDMRAIADSKAAAASPTHTDGEAAKSPTRRAKRRPRY